MTLPGWNRRTFLKASLAGTLLFFGTAGRSGATIPDRLPEGRLLLYNTHTEERLDVLYRDPENGYRPDALDSLNRILRCHYTQQTAEMDLRVIEFVNAVDKQLGGGHEIHIISGYRSPEYNDLLIRKGRNVARHSLHLSGKAIDIRIPKVGLDILKRTAHSLRYGGVGYYPKSGFVHLDSGRFRSW
ncbi:MAG: DUF882 domain-containing protein [Nitrospirae bacterium]|nr:DUF882 domain-containing protein [Nitrospirota bacterium]